ncbi:MAG: MAPEG family protein, partial [Methylibium sp.]|nr:MAPEG family protein [Methylibium sp.]
ALVLVADAVDVHNAATVMACVVFFWARVVHFLAYSFKVPWARTLAFAVGFVSQLALAFQVLT